jgi:hypothetical protein
MSVIDHGVPHDRVPLRCVIEPATVPHPAPHPSPSAAGRTAVLLVFVCAFSAGATRADKTIPLPGRCAKSSEQRSCESEQGADRYVLWHRELLRPLRLHLDELPDPSDDSDVGLSRLEAESASRRSP